MGISSCILELIDPKQEVTKQPVITSRLDVVFAHHSEEIFANLLDFYKVRWEYEPRAFVLLRDEDGNIKESFTPDFYLPDYDLYIELTTRRKNLGTRKRRRIERLEELYPDIKIRLFHPKDIQKLMVKYSIPAQTKVWRNAYLKPINVLSFGSCGIAKLFLPVFTWYK